MEWINAKIHSLLDGAYNAIVSYGWSVIILLIHYVGKKLFHCFKRWQNNSVEVSGNLNMEVSMEKNIIDGQELDIDFKIENGKIVFMPKYAGNGGYAKMEVGVDAEYFLKKLAEKIPGTFDDAVIAIAIQAIKAL